MTHARATEILFGSRHPFQIYMLLLCLFTGLPLLFGRYEPRSIEAQLPGWGVTLWGATLFFGALVALVGIFLPNRVNGLLVEGIGLIATGVAAIIYAVAIIFTIGSAGVVASGIVVGFGISCVVRWFQLNTVLSTFVRGAETRAEVH